MPRLPRGVTLEDGAYLVPKKLVERVAFELEQNDGRSLREICDELGVARTLVLWYVDQSDYVGVDSETVDRYSRALARIVDNSVAEVEQIAIGAHRGGLDRFEDTGTHVARDQLMLKAKTWALGKMMPTKLGDRKEEKPEGPQKVVIVGGLPDEA